jgi:hypothetical protein
MTELNTANAGPTPLIERVKGILLQPNTEWDRINEEPATTAGIFTGYVLPLAAIPVVAQLVHGLVFGYGGMGIVVHLSPLVMITQAIVGYVLGVAMVYVLALIIDGLAPSFGGQKNQIQALKVAAYSGTAGWVAGILNLVPVLGALAILGALYSLYLLYRGLPKLMKAPEDKAFGYTAVTVIVAVVLGIVVSAVMGAVTLGLGGAGLMGAGLLGGHRAESVSGTVSIPGGGSVDLDKLNKASERMKAMQAGKIKPVDAEKLKALLPDSIAGYSRTEVSAESGSAGGVGGSEAHAVYTKGDSRLNLSVTDATAMGAMASLGGALNVESNKQTATGYEKVGKVDGRFTTEEFDSQTHHGKYATMVAERFMVEAEGDNISMDDLKAAIRTINLGQLESLSH